MEGNAPYYEDGGVIYSKKGKFYVADGWVYSLNGQPAYYFG